MKVTVRKARKSTYWYASHIGEEFEVLNNRIYTKPNGIKSYHVKNHPHLLIDVNDCTTKEKVIFT